MDTIIDLHRLDGENEEKFIWRLGCAKDTGLIDLNWDEIAEIINKEFRTDESEYRAESAYRKSYSQAKRFFEAGVFNALSDNEYFKKLQIQKQELMKERQKLSDERIELNRQIRQEARKESYINLIKRIICEDVAPINVTVNYTLFDSNTDLLCHLSDIHTGIEIDNWKNTFNEDVLKQRIEKYTSDILDIRGQHGSENCYLVIGEIISGLIHNNLRLQNNMDMMEQFKYVSELITAMLVRMANHFHNINVYVTPGNHSRIVAKKEDSLDGENMDVLLPFYLKARLKNIKNIHIMENMVDPEIAMFNIRGVNVFSSHGHKDSPASVVQNFTMLFGIKPDIVLLGHRHTNGMSTVYDTKVIQSGSVSGADQYSMSLRKCNKPEQTVSVISDKGLLCLYDIKLG